VSGPLPWVFVLTTLESMGMTFGHSVESVNPTVCISMHF